MGFCDSVKVPRTPRKKIKHFPKNAKLARYRFRGDIREDSPLQITHEYGVDVLCQKKKESFNMLTGTFYEGITDTSGLIQNWWNPCHHEEYSGLLNIQPIEFTSGHIVGRMTFEGKYTVLDLLRSHIPKPSDNELDDMSAKAYNHFVNATGNGQESLANFLIEIYQAIQGNVKLLKKYKGLIEKIKAAYHKALDKYLGEGQNQTSAHWLAWNFAVKPLIGDLKRIACMWRRAYKRFLFLRARNHKPTKVQFRILNCYEPESDIIVINDDHGIPSATYWSNPEYECIPGLPTPEINVEADVWLELRKQSYTLDFTATGWVLWNLPDWLFASPEVGISALVTQQEGFSNPIKIIWNAIPYTWLLDWFVSYRTHLQENAADLGPYSDGQLLKAGHAFKLKSIWNVVVCYNHDGGYSEQTLGQVVYNTYVRKLGLPEPQVSPFRVPWEGYNLSIVTALVHQRWDRRRVRKPPTIGD